MYTPHPGEVEGPRELKKKLEKQKEPRPIDSLVGPTGITSAERRYQFGPGSFGSRAWTMDFIAAGAIAGSHSHSHSRAR